MADKWEEYDKRVNKDKEDPEKVLNNLGIKRYCCRSMLISSVDVIDQVLPFYSRKADLQ